jgi:hypothetical protein
MGGENNERLRPRDKRSAIQADEPIFFGFFPIPFAINKYYTTGLFEWATPFFKFFLKALFRGLCVVFERKKGFFSLFFRRTPHRPPALCDFP